MNGPVENIDYDEAHDVEEVKSKPVRISLHLIQKRNLSNGPSDPSQESIVKELNKITHLRLDRENIGQIDNLELLGNRLTNIYLQKNKIKVIENLDCLPNLSFLTLAGNNIQRIQGLTHVPRLIFLDLSDNQIEDFDIDELPQSLKVLNLRGNPCTNVPDFRGRILQDLANLQQLDGIAVTREERRESGFVVSSDEEDTDSDKDDDSLYDDYVMDSARESLEFFERTGRTTDQESLLATTNDILERSQERMEDLYMRHKQKMDMLANIREYKNLPKSARSQKNSASLDFSAPS